MKACSWFIQQWSFRDQCSLQIIEILPYKIRIPKPYIGHNFSLFPACVPWMGALIRSKNTNLYKSVCHYTELKKYTIQRKLFYNYIKVYKYAKLPSNELMMWLHELKISSKSNNDISKWMEDIFKWYVPVIQI